MFLTECEAVVCARSSWLARSPLRLRAECLLGLMSITLWGESCDMHTGFQVKMENDYLKRKTKALLEWYLFSYYII